jgi:hypothetical protein
MAAKKKKARSRSSRRGGQRRHGNHLLDYPMTPEIKSVLAGADPFPMLRDFFASSGKKRRLWLAALDQFGYRDLDKLMQIGREYGTASGIELKDAIVGLYDMRRSQGRTRPR